MFAGVFLMGVVLLGTGTTGIPFSFLFLAVLPFVPVFLGVWTWRTNPNQATRLASAAAILGGAFGVVSLLVPTAIVLTGRH